MIETIEKKSLCWKIIINMNIVLAIARNCMNCDTKLKIISGLFLKFS